MAKLANWQNEQNEQNENVFVHFYRRVRYRSSNFRPSVRSFVRPFVRPSTFTSKLSFLDISDSWESETLHSNCP